MKTLCLLAILCSGCYGVADMPCNDQYFGNIYFEGQADCSLSTFASTHVGQFLVDACEFDSLDSFKAFASHVNSVTVKDVQSWDQPFEGSVIGYTNTVTNEVQLNNTMQPLLHELYHVRHGPSHDHWYENGFYALDHAYSLEIYYWTNERNGAPIPIVQQDVNFSDLTQRQHECLKAAGHSIK